MASEFHEVLKDNNETMYIVYPADDQDCPCYLRVDKYNHQLVSFCGKDWFTPLHKFRVRNIVPLSPQNAGN